MKDVTRIATIGVLPVQRRASSEARSCVGSGAITAIQFSSEDVGIEVAVSRARTIDAGGFQLRLATAGDLLVLRLAAAEEPQRRTSKRRQDLLDIITLAEEHPSSAMAVPQLRQRVERLSANLLKLGLTRGPER